MKKKCSIIFLIMALVFSFSLSSIQVFADNNVNVIVNGKAIEFNVQPQIIDGRTYIQLAPVGNALDMKSTWDGATRSVTVRRGNKQLILKIDSKKIDVKSIANESIDTSVETDAAPRIINDRTMLPLRPIIEQFGGQLAWDDSTRTVTIIDGYKDKVSYDVYYSQFSGIPNFGSITGLRTVEGQSDPNGIMYKGNDMTEDMLNDYILALDLNGFTYDKASSDSSKMVVYSKDNTFVSINWDSHSVKINVKRN